MPRISIAVLAGMILLSGCSQQAREVSEPKPKPVQGSYADNRIIFDLNPEERDHFIGEMHSYLVATEGVIMGLAENDMSAVADAAYKVTPQGHERPSQEMRQAIHGKMPEGFQPMNRSVRKGFQAIYEKAKAGERASEIQAELAKALQLCSACHAAYQVPTK